MGIKAECFRCGTRREIEAPGWWPSTDKYHTYVCQSCLNELYLVGNLEAVQLFLDDLEKKLEKKGRQR